MKIKIQFKDPDAPYEAIRDAAEEQVLAIEGISEDEAESLIDKRHGQIAEKLRKWIKFGEYVTIEFDIEEQTAIVIPVK
jgi:nitrogen regulatory protein PII-like uncharacterized protein